MATVCPKSTSLLPIRLRWGGGVRAFFSRFLCVLGASALFLGRYPFLQDLRKLAGQPPGAAEQAGVAIGDVIHGINYEPLERGLRHTSALLAKAISLAGFVKLQVGRICFFVFYVRVCVFFKVRWWICLIPCA